MHCNPGDYKYHAIHVHVHVEHLDNKFRIRHLVLDEVVLSLEVQNVIQSYSFGIGSTILNLSFI